MMAGSDSRPLAEPVVNGWHRCHPTQRLFVVLTALAICISPEVLAWNPYDTDSSWSASAPMSRYSAAPGDRSLAQPPDDAYASQRTDQYWSRGWDESSRWYQAEQRADSRSDADSTEDFGWGSSQPWEGKDAGRGWNQPDWPWGQATGGTQQWHESRRGSVHSWRTDEDARFTDTPASVRGGYEFRHDPSLDVSRGTQANGWDFRPLSDREQDRALAEGVYPRIDERDYLPRGPWRSYEDEGTAFGYHANDRWPGDSARPR